MRYAQVMAHAWLQEIRLERFKSYHDAIIPLENLAVLTGRNSSGKSNIFDAIEVLSRVCGTESLADALDGRSRGRTPVRGGARGCAPFGESTFAIGCLIAVDDGAEIEYSITIEVEPYLRVVKERMEARHPELRNVLFEAEDGQQGSLRVVYSNGRRGTNPSTHVRDDRSVLGQLTKSVLAETETVRRLLTSAAVVVATLSNTFHLDPVPQLMREYTAPHESRLRRNGENLAAACLALRESDPERFDRLEGLVRTVADCDVAKLDFSRTDEDQVMLALVDGEGRRTTARLMSDGLLRFIAVATALMTASTSLDVDPSAAVVGDSHAASGVLLAIEEIENGLHPSHAALLLDLVEDAASEPGVVVLITTHSPALLDHIEGSLMKDVWVSHAGRVTRLTELPGYAQAMARGPLGRVVSQGELVSGSEPVAANDYSAFLRLIGAEA